MRLGRYNRTRMPDSGGDEDAAPLQSQYMIDLHSLGIQHVKDIVRPTPALLAAAPAHNVGS